MLSFSIFNNMVYACHILHNKKTLLFYTLQKAVKYFSFQEMKLYDLTLRGVKPTGM